MHRQVPAYQELLRLFDFFARWHVMPFDEQAASEFQSLRAHRSHIGTMDLKIAAITLHRGALLLSASLQALANEYIGYAYVFQGEYRRALESLSQAVVFFEGGRCYERCGQIFLPAVLSRALAATCYAELGAFAEGRVLGEAGLRIAEVDQQPADLLFAAWGIGHLALRQGDLPRALALLARAVSLCQDVDLPAFFPWLAPELGAAYTLAGRLTDAVPLLTRALEQTTVMERVDSQVLGRLALGEAQMRAGCLEEAHALAAQAHTLACARQERGHQAYALHLLGEIATRRDPPQVELAVAHYQQAIALAEALGMRPLQAHCHLCLGALYATTGQREPARAALATAMALYRAMDMTFWLPQAEAVLAQAE